MTNDYEDMTVAELEQHHDRTRRKAKRRPQWQKPANRIAKALASKKRDRIAELESEVEEGEPSYAAQAATRGLGEEPTDVAELRDELDRHRSDVAELERTVPDDQVEEL